MNTRDQIEKFGADVVLDTELRRAHAEGRVSDAMRLIAAFGNHVRYETERATLLELRSFITQQGLKMKGARLVQEIDAYLATRLHGIAMDRQHRAENPSNKTA